MSESLKSILIVVFDSSGVWEQMSKDGIPDDALVSPEAVYFDKNHNIAVEFSVERRMDS